jgi:WD40 repeat protein
MRAYLPLVVLMILLGPLPMQATAQPSCGTLTGHTLSVMSVAFSKDGKTLASGSLDKSVKLWDVTTGKNTATLEGHEQSVWFVALARMTAHLSHSVRTNRSGVDVKTGKTTRTFEGSGP